MLKQNKIRFLKGDFYKAQEMLCIYIKACCGYVLYEFTHSMDKEINCNCWRIQNAFQCDEELNIVKRLTEQGEWECAVRLAGRSDFSGGAAHGDEIFKHMRMLMDGRVMEVESLGDLTEFSTLSIVEASILYDPEDSITEIAEHGKTYIFSEKGVDIEQYLLWKVKEELANCFMAMFPISKTVSQYVYFDIDCVPKQILSREKIQKNNAQKVITYSAGNDVIAEFSVSKYPTGLPGGDVLYIADNGGLPYNKIYYRICNSGKTSVGELWKSISHYRIWV